jgi:hypothetical protein
MLEVRQAVVEHRSEMRGGSTGFARPRRVRVHDLHRQTITLQ